jgi:hypothetical protein
METDFRKWFKRQIGKRGELISQFVIRSGIPRPTINEWLRFQAPNIRPDKIKQLAAAFAMEYEEVERVLAEAKSASLSMEAEVAQGAWNLPRSPVVPRFDRNLAAGFWTEAIGVNESETSQLEASLGLFQVRISGDSMEPEYPEGCVVEFRVVRVADDGIEIGKNFYIHRDDDMATFKHVTSADEETVTLSAINIEKYPRSMIVERSRIVRAARALKTLLNPDK